MYEQNHDPEKLCLKSTLFASTGLPYDGGLELKENTDFRSYPSIDNYSRGNNWLLNTLGLEKWDQFRKR